MADRRSNADVDISTRRPEPRGGRRGCVVLWGTVLVVAAVVIYFQWPIWWIFGVTVGALLLYAFAALAWLFIVQRGALTWMRQAFKPAKLMALGETAAAEAACAAALMRARRFAPDDRRRGLMLCELAMFVKNQGRFQEALALYEESVAILEKKLAASPFEYFVALNNYGICFIQLRDYQAAQRILEKAIDLTLSVRKREGDRSAVMPLGQVQMVQFVLHLNLAFLLMEMREMREAELQLRDADALMPLLSKRTRAAWYDHYVGICALWEFESGKFAAAEDELAQAGNPDFPSCLRVRAKLHLVRQEFAEAERLLRRYQETERKKGTLHRPDLLKATLDLAEALFGQGKHDDAVAALQEARSIVADYALPADDAWRRTLESWRDRARELGKANLAESLAADLHKMPAPTPQAIAILDKLRIRNE